MHPLSRRHWKPRPERHFSWKVKTHIRGLWKLVLKEVNGGRLNWECSSEKNDWAPLVDFADRNLQRGRRETWTEREVVDVGAQRISPNKVKFAISICSMCYSLQVPGHVHQHYGNMALKSTLLGNTLMLVNSLVSNIAVLINDMIISC